MLQSTFMDKVAQFRSLNRNDATRAEKLWRSFAGSGVKTTQEMSRDRKLGPMWATYRRVGFDLASAGTCSKEACDFADAGCYAQKGNVDLHSKASPQASTDGLQLYYWTISRPLHAKARMHVSGDFGRYVQGLAGEVLLLDWTYLAGFLAGALDRPDIRWIVYTALWRLFPKWLVEEFKRAGVVLNASVQRSEPDSAYREARDKGFKLARALDKCEWDGKSANVTIAGQRVLVCPEIRNRKLKRAPIDCATCQYCAKDREGMVGFPIH